MRAAHVDVFHWNPRGNILPKGFPVRVRVGRRINNFGDLLAPIIVANVANQLGLDLSRPARKAQLMSVGSVLHFAHPGAVVWGSGINNKLPVDPRQLSTLDVRAVRGPLTRQILQKAGARVPEVYGDPACLLGLVRPDLRSCRPERSHLVVPNLNDVAEWSDGPFLDPRAPLDEVLRLISTSEFVTGSSLHAIVAAEALGIPARLIAPSVEPPLKYQDYYLGTGRSGYLAADCVQHAMELGGETMPDLKTDGLLAAFPRDLWLPRERDPD